MARSYSLGVDIGGTFTDIVVLDQSAGAQFNSKVLTTHDNPSRGVLDGVKALLRKQEINAADIVRPRNSRSSGSKRRFC